jgi:hypothetical protein
MTRPVPAPQFAGITAAFDVLGPALARITDQQDAMVRQALGPALAQMAEQHAAIVRSILPLVDQQRIAREALAPILATHERLARESMASVLENLRVALDTSALVKAFVLPPDFGDTLRGAAQALAASIPTSGRFADLDWVAEVEALDLDTFNDVEDPAALASLTSSGLAPREARAALRLIVLLAVLGLGTEAALKSFHDVESFLLTLLAFAYLGRDVGTSTVKATDRLGLTSDEDAD